jgi:thiol-disulfide isomerase/thioredoxin
MDYYNKIVILKKYFMNQINKNDIKNANKSLISIKNLHGKIIEHILLLKDSDEDNKLELLSDLERINYKIILILNECEDISQKNNEDDDNDEDDEDDGNDENNENDENDEGDKDENNKEKLNKKIPSLILFHAEWCGHCRNFMPTWNALSDIIPNDQVNMVKISCVEKEKQCNSIKEIKGFPTIMYIDINLNKKIIYSGQRTPESIINFINECNGKQIIKLTN